MPRRNAGLEKCALCSCQLHRSGEYATPTLMGRSHATEHHFVPERFFGRSTNRRGTQRKGIYACCPWGYEGKKEVYCYECHEELLHNPVLLPEDVAAFANLVRNRGLDEITKPESREKIGGRIELLHEVISAGLKTLNQQQEARPKLNEANDAVAKDNDRSCYSLHAALERLPLWREPQKVPFNNGLYFFYERGETSPHAPLGRVVRVGNHPKSDDSLTRRLRQHYSGRKNGSVFRRYLGGALIRALDPDNPCLMPMPGRGHWERQGQGTCQLCDPVEKKVSLVLRETFPFRCVEIVNRSERNSLEEALIDSFGL
jgi:hypothetical protein